jgi:hypothetical protein
MVSEQHTNLIKNLVFEHAKHDVVADHGSRAAGQSNTIRIEIMCETSQQRNRWHYGENGGREHSCHKCAEIAK